MTRRRHADLLPRVRLAIGSLLGILVLTAAPGAAAAQTPLTRLALSPVDQPGSYFDLTMAPGERKAFEVAISNDGAAEVAARTYPADVYTIVNGEFGGRLRDEPQTGMTAWLDYAPESIRLAPGERTRRSFEVDVPADAGPGEYITSLILEHDQAVEAGAAIGVEQVVRQAIAVVVTIPGRRSPAFEVGAASHEVVAGRSIVSIAVSNTGNVRLKPVIDITLSEAAGELVSHASVAMDTFYADTATSVEVPLAALLLPGRYSVRLTWDDPGQGLQGSEDTIPLVIVAPPPSGPNNGAAAGLTEVIQGVGGGTQLPFWGVLLAVLLAVGLVVGVIFSVRRRRSRDV